MVQIESAPVGIQRVSRIVGDHLGVDERIVGEDGETIIEPTHDIEFNAPASLKARKLQRRWIRRRKIACRQIRFRELEYREIRR